MAKDALRFLNLDPSSPVNCNCDILDKETSAFNYVQYMLDRTNTMFHYEGLPDTIPEPMFEYMLQVYGSVAIIKYKGDIYAIRANFGGPLDPYYRPTHAVMANPALGLTGTYKVINHLPPFNRRQWDEMEPCIRFLNDSQIMGLLPLFSRYAVQMTENDISIRCAQINIRSQHVITAESGVDIESANAYMKGIEEGRLSAIMKKAFSDGIQVTNTSQGQSNVVMQLIELQQYLKASWYNEIGLNSNFNMKSQYISSEEINSSADIMLPLVDNMFRARQTHVEFMNKHFGTNITVEKDSAWEKKQIQSDLGVQIDPVNGDIISSNTPDSNDSITSISSSTSSEESLPDSNSPVDLTQNPELLEPIDTPAVIEINPDPGTVVTVTVEDGGGEFDASEPDTDEDSE